jgi:TonB-dependent receptor
VGAHLIGDLSLARDPAAWRAALGVGQAIPTDGPALGHWRLLERSVAAYAQGRFEWPEQAVDGQLGVRAVYLDRQASGWQALTGAAPSPTEQTEARLDWLPSADLRWRPLGDWTLRAGASRSVGWPNFNNLSPTLLLNPNSVDPSLNQGSGGNPALQPLTSNNLDLAVAHAGGSRASSSAALFLKQVRGFISNASRTEQHDGAAYQISRPYNGTAGRILGLELGHQQFFDGLPGPWQGLGLQASYTLIASRTHDPLLGEVMMQNLSRHSANLVGLYEQGPWSARLAWNWRSKYLSGATQVVGVGSLPNYTQGYGWLDASVSWRVSAKATVGLEGMNLLRTLRRSDDGTSTLPQSQWLNDRQWSAFLRLNL